MKKSSRSVRAAIAAGALSTAVIGIGVIGGPASAQNPDDCYPSKKIIDPCYYPTTIDRPTTTVGQTTVPRETTTTEGERPTTTEGERPTTTARPTTTTAPTTTAPAVGNANAASPVAARAAYTG